MFFSEQKWLEEKKQALIAAKDHVDRLHMEKKKLSEHRWVWSHPKPEFRFWGASALESCKSREEQQKCGKRGNKVVNECEYTQIKLLKLLKKKTMAKSMYELTFYVYACVDAHSKVYCWTPRWKFRKWRPMRKGWWSLWGTYWRSMSLCLRMNPVQTRRRRCSDLFFVFLQPVYMQSLCCYYSSATYHMLCFVFRFVFFRTFPRS